MLSAKEKKLLNVLIANRILDIPKAEECAGLLTTARQQGQKVGLAVVIISRGYATKEQLWPIVQQVEKQLQSSSPNIPAIPNTQQLNKMVRPKHTQPIPQMQPPQSPQSPVNAVETLDGSTPPNRPNSQLNLPGTQQIPQMQRPVAPFNAAETLDEGFTKSNPKSSEIIMKSIDLGLENSATDVPPEFQNIPGTQRMPQMQRPVANFSPVETLGSEGISIESSDSRGIISTQNRPLPNQISRKVANEREKTKPQANHLNVEIGEVFAHYKIEKVLGKGGMGAVYQAQDTKLGRKVALKVILANENVSEVQIKRFMQEAKATAQLKHRNIIDMYEVGDSPKDYFTMEHIEGGDLSSLIPQNGMNPLEAAKIMYKCADAIGFAHKNGILHRDIKPTNILMQHKKEPKIMDFGLAKIANDDQQLSQSGAMLGTPAYMPPEQADGNPASESSDVYSLGATLYQMLTGRTVFQSDSYMKLITQIFREDPVPPRRLNPDIPKDLEAICLKCLEKKQVRRYKNGQALARDLSCFLSNKPIKAKPATTWTHLSKWVIRNKALAMSIFATILLISIGVTTFTVLLALDREKLSVANNLLQEEKNLVKQTNEKLQEKQDLVNQINEKLQIEKQKAVSEKEKAEHAKNKAEDALYRAYLKLANNAVQNQNWKEVIHWTNQFESENSGFPLDKWEWRWLKNSEDAAIKTIDEAHGVAEIYSCAFSPDGKFFASGGDARKNFKEGAKLWKVSEFRKDKFKELKGHEDKVRGCCFSPNGKFLALGSDNKIILWDIKTKKRKILLFDREDRSLRDCTFNRQGNLLAAVFTSPDQKEFSINDGIQDLEEMKKKVQRERENVVIWNLKNLDEPYQIIEGTQLPIQNDVITCDFSADGKMLFFAGEEEREDRTHIIRCWDITQKKFLPPFLGHSDDINSCAVSPDGKWLASASTDHSIIIWDIANRKPWKTLLRHTHEVRHCIFHPDGDKLLSVGYDNLLIYWDVPNGKVIREFVGHRNKINRCALHPSGSYVVTASEDRSLRFWSLQGGANSMQVFTVPPPQSDIAGVDIEKVDGKISKINILRDNYSSIHTWDSQTQEFSPKPKYTMSITKSFANHPTQPIIVTSNIVIGKVKLWNTHTGEAIYEFQKHNSEVSFCGFDKTGKKLATGDDRGIVKIWSWESLLAKNEKLLEEIDIFKDKERINHFCFSPNGESVAIANEKGLCGIWHIPSKRKIFIKIPIIRKTICEICWCEFSPDGKTLAIAAKKYLALFHVQNGSPKTLYDIQSEYRCCSFNNQGDRLVSGGKDGELRVWNVGTSYNPNLDLNPLFQLPGHTNRVRVCFFADDDTIVSCSDDHTMRIWRAKPIEK